MKDAAPRIFRSLERQQVQREFDTVVAAAVAAYGALRHPSQRQADDLGRLVLPLWSKIGAETRRNLAATLSHSARVPRGLVEKLLDAPIEVSAPFLISSPVLSESDIASLQQSADERIVRLLDNRLRRAEGPAPAAEAAAEEIASPIQETAEQPRAAEDVVASSPALSPEFLSETPLIEPAQPQRRAGPSVDGVREALKRLALTGRSAPAVPPAEPETLLLLAMQRREPAFYDALARALQLDEKSVHSIVEDGTGDRLAVALKALRIGSADAMSMLMMLKPAIGLDVLAFDRLALFYRTLKAEDCRSMVNAARLRPAPQHSALGATERLRAFEPARRQFGRRTEMPLPREAKN